MNIGSIIGAILMLGGAISLTGDTTLWRTRIACYSIWIGSFLLLKFG